MQTDAAKGVCEYHLQRKGVFVPASRVVNDEPMCAKCFAGVAIFNFERTGDKETEKRSYLSRSEHYKERKRFRDALWRARQREKSRLTGAPSRRDPYESAPAAPACPALGD